MQPVLIKIRLSSIRKNPDYCPPGMVQRVAGKRSIYVDSAKPLPVKIAKHFYLSGCTLNGKTRVDCSYIGKGHVPEEVISYLHDRIGKNGISVNIENSPREVVSPHGSPFYLFDYQNPLLRCDDCGNLIRFMAIQYTTISYDEYDEINADQCPVCQGINTFDYKMERIEAAMKRSVKLHNK